MATTSRKTTKTTTTKADASPQETAQQTTTSQSYSPDNIGHLAAAKQAEQDAYRSARIYAEVYCQTYDELKGRAIIGIWQDKLNAGQDFNAEQYIPDQRETQKRAENLARQLTPQSTITGLLPGQF